MSPLSWDEAAWMLDWMKTFGEQGDEEWHYALEMHTLLRDRRYALGMKKRASLMGLIDDSLESLFDLTPLFAGSSSNDGQSSIVHMTWDTRGDLHAPHHDEDALILDARGFPPEGEDSAARWMVRAYQQGWKRLIVHNWKGGRFAGCGFGANTQGLSVDLYGDVGDYAASGLDGAEVHLHSDGQDQMGQILKRGKLVVHGDVGQTFLYGAKGGEIYVLGSAAGRPLINAVGRPRAVINGTCLDYLAESFMAGDPLKGGGFVILNGIHFDDDGQLRDLPSPYPGGNLFSLASGGAIYLRDPHLRVDEDQLNGGAFAELSQADWELIEPYLNENERLFEISVKDLLTVDGVLRTPEEVYRKVAVRNAGVLQDTGLAAETENR
jgi:glutamate synthase domain-containing protein 3